MIDRARSEAWDLVELASRDPGRAAELATTLLDSPASSAPAVAACARLTLALVHLDGANPAAAEDHIVHARAAAVQSGDQRILGRVLATHMGVAARTGRPELALRIAEQAQEQLDGRALVHILINRATVLAIGFGRPLDAIAAYDEVDRSASDLPDDLRAILLMNRGTQHMRVGNLAAAQRDLGDAARAYEQLDKPHARIDAAMHLAIVAARRADFQTLFELYQTLVVDGSLSDNPHHYIDLSECLLAAGLVAEAQQTCARAIARTPNPSTEATLLVRVLASEIATRSGRSTDAADLARDAHRAATEVGNRSVMARAEALLMLADSNGVDADRAARAIDALDEVGLADDAMRVALGVGTRCFVRGDRSAVQRLLTNRRFSDDTSAPARARRHHCASLVLAAFGDRAAARRLLAHGIAELERERATLAAPDLRAAASDRAPAMAELGLRLAVDAGRPRPVLEWAERVRAASLRLADPVRRDAEMLEQLDELRRVDGAEPAKAAGIERRITVQQRTQRADGVVVRNRNAGEICAALGDRHTLLEYIELDGRLMVCVVDRRRASLIDLDVAVDELEAATGKILFGLRRMATRSGRATDAAAAMVAQLGERLGERLLPARRLHGEQIVIVPTGPLHHLPWAVLPRLADQPFVVAPSAHIWCETKARGRWGDGLLASVGPNLEAARDEALAVARAWRSRRKPVPGTADLMRQRLPGSAVAHLCCHGRFRTDSPQFSALELHDGPFTVFDLEGVADLPPVVVLSACSLGSVDVHVGDDLLGFPAALFARGVSTLVAAVLPVEDGATRDLMVRLHEGLASGVGVAESLRDARAAAATRGGRHAAAAASFLCFGAG